MGQMTIFNELAFMGIHNLCGPPLAINCQNEDSNRRRQGVDNKDDDDGFVD